MLRKLLCSLAFCTLFVASAVAANDVVKWVDADGVTHFGNAQFAPPGTAEAVELHPANGMDVPEVPAVESPKRFQTVVLKRKKRTNPRGFRGYYGRSPVTTSRIQGRTR